MSYSPRKPCLPKMMIAYNFIPDYVILQNVLCLRLDAQTIDLLYIPKPQARVVLIWEIFAYEMHKTSVSPKFKYVSGFSCKILIFFQFRWCHLFSQTMKAKACPQGFEALICTDSPNNNNNNTFYVAVIYWQHRICELERKEEMRH